MIIADLTRLSPNVNRGQNNVPIPMPDTCRTVIIHCTRSGTSMNPSEYIGTLNYMSQPGTTSSQLVIGRKAGQIARVVPDSQQAWHAGVDNDNAWGIEIEQGVEDDGFTDEQLAQVVEAAKHYLTLGVPARHATTSTEGGFIGHQETAQGKGSGKSDPGRKFPWGWFIAQLQEETMAPTLEEIALAFGSYIHFVRNNFNLADLSERDKQCIAAAATSIPGLPGFFTAPVEETR